MTMESEMARQGSHPYRGALAACLAVLLIAFGLLGFQNNAGAFRSDLGSDPDEPAHAVTALMVRDYVVDGFGTSPLRFAQDYYDAFPKVALGHYPPGYYLIAAVALLILPQVNTLLVLQALFAAALAVSVFALGRSWIGRVPAVVSAMLVLLLPITQKLLLHVMADLLLAVVCLASVAVWAAYLDKPSIRHSLGFGLLAAFAILTKGSGLMLAAVPPVATALAGKWSLLKRIDWWLAALPVALIAGPWMWFSVRFTQEGMQHVSPLQFLPEAAAFYREAIPASIGYLLSFALLATFVITVINRFRGVGLKTQPAVLWAMIAGGATVMLLVPAGTSSRYLMPMIGPVALLVVGAAAAWLNHLPVLARVMIGLVCLAVVVDEAGLPPVKEVTGFGDGVAKMLPAVHSATAGMPGVWLVSSDPRGEGAVIAAAAFGVQQRAPSVLRILRASKELASSDWMGRGYESRFHSESELLSHLDQQEVDVVFVDGSVPSEAGLKHHDLLLRTLTSATSIWRLEVDNPVARSPEQHARLKVFRRIADS